MPPQKKQAVREKYKEIRNYSNGPHLRIGSPNPYPEGHTCAIIPEADNGIVLSESAISRIEGMLENHKEKLEEHKEAIINENQADPGGF